MNEFSFFLFLMDNIYIYSFNDLHLLLGILPVMIVTHLSSIIRKAHGLQMKKNIEIVNPLTNLIII